MRCALGGLVCMGFMTGCSYGPNRDDIAGRAQAVDHVETPSPGPPADEHDGRGQDGGRIFTFRPPSGEGPSYKGALEVVARSEAGEVGEGYRVRVFALVPRGPGEEPRKVTLGEQDIFRPPAPGEETTIPIDEIKPEAWVAMGEEGYELRLGVEALPALPGRKRPEVSLRVVDARLKAN